MNSKFKIWLSAARLRTLPLSVAGIITGNALAIRSDQFSIIIFILSLLTAVCFQIISNFANDYGDGIRGTDNDERLGPQRTLQQGLLTAPELKKGIAFTALISIFLSFILIYVSLGWNSLLISILFLFLAFSAVIAAIKYTVGKTAYGYSGLGDLFVFLFFGLVSVLGAYYLQSKIINVEAIYFAVSIGLLSVGVLNLNNMRDISNDKNSQKNTLAVIMGSKKAKLYHFFLIATSALTLLLGVGIDYLKTNQFYIIIFFPLIYHFLIVWNIKEPKAFDPLLKQLALSTFFIALFLIFIFSII